jgi:sulfite reductase beta subunit-like hemoprotein
MGERLTEVTEGDDETVFYMLLDFAGMNEEFPAADLDPLGYAAVLDAAEAHASVERAERRSAGRSRTHYRILARDVEEFREKLASALRPLCRKLASPS